MIGEMIIMPKSRITEKEKKESQQRAAKVKQLRIDNKLTQADVAKELNVTPGFISNVEKGRTAMSLRLLVYYARLTGTTLDILVGDMIPEYQKDALDHELHAAVSRLNENEKRKLIRILDILLEGKQE